MREEKKNLFVRFAGEPAIDIRYICTRLPEHGDYGKLVPDTVYEVETRIPQPFGIAFIKLCHIPGWFSESAFVPCERGLSFVSIPG